MILEVAGSVTAVAGVAAYGAFSRNNPVFGRVITKLPANGNTVSITFDDGPNPYATPAILDALSQYDVKATFFFLGRHVERWPEIVARAAAQGHQIGNHGYYHRKLHLKSPSYVRDDLERGTRAIKAAGGGTPTHFRAPHGFRNPWVTPIARSLGQRTVGWSLGVWDSDCPGAGEIAKRAIAGVRPGSILLLHDGDGYDPLGDRQQTAAALPEILETLTQRGYRFETLPPMIPTTFGRVIRYLVTAAIVVLLIAFARTVDWTAAWTSMRNASLPLLTAAILINILSLLIRGVRWWILLRAAGAPSLGLALRATVAGAGLNNVLIANGGDAARVVFITRATGLSSSKVLATVALDRLFDPIGFLALLAVGMLALPVPPAMEKFRWPAMIVFLLSIILLVWLSLTGGAIPPEHTPERRAEPRNWQGRLRAWFTEFGGSMRHLASGPRVFWVVILTLLAWLCQLATFAYAAAAAHVSLSLAGNLASLLAVNVSLIVRATPGNVGFFQFAYALATEPFGVSKEAAVAVSLLIQTLQIIPVTLLGVALAPEFILRKRDPSTL